ncbi:PREDICTED: acyl-CoA Delta(11) desaturase-like, partial [Dinoponera quadriceps]|uniref:Acyl-CoA Delta(11) desaturase-like n=1 Tax=Dinoponera quadriceps TaxID=609295 RepID=A0A6P3XPQ3_DINQU
MNKYTSHIDAHLEIKKKNFSEMMDKIFAQNKHKFLTNIKEWKNVLSKLKLLNIIVISAIHLGALYSLFSLDLTINIKTILWCLFICLVQAIGVTAGAHRLWTHRTYKAKLPLKIILLICYAVGNQIPLHSWVRDHRIHHKCMDTDADPHNSNRGFFFSHVGWLLVKKKSEVINEGRQIDLTDLDTDPILVFYDKYFWIFSTTFCHIIPITIPVYMWHEAWTNSIKIDLFRIAFGLNAVWSVNSFAHMWGTKPYNMNINPTDNSVVSFFSYGEGWHN